MNAFKFDDMLLNQLLEIGGQSTNNHIVYDNFNTVISFESDEKQDSLQKLQFLELELANKPNDYKRVSS